jgi:hypothetical protein
MPDLSRAVEMPADQPSVHDQAGANARADSHRGQRGSAPPEAEHPLSESEGIHVVVDEDGVAASRVDEGGERHVAQVGEPGGGYRSHGSLLDVDEAGKPDADSGHAAAARMGRGERTIDQREDRVHHGTAAPGGCLGSSEDGAVGPHQPSRDRRGSHIHPDHRVR